MPLLSEPSSPAAAPLPGLPLVEEAPRLLSPALRAIPAPNVEPKLALLPLRVPVAMAARRSAASAWLLAVKPPSSSASSSATAPAEPSRLP